MSQWIAIISSGIGLLPVWHQAIIWTSADLSIGPFRINFSEIWIKMQWYSFNESHFNMSSTKCHPFGLLRPHYFNSSINAWCICTLKFNNFQTHIVDKFMGHFLLNCPQVNATWPHWWSVDTALVNGLVSLGNKPLPEPMLTQIYVALGITRLQWVNVSLC